jgi:PAS domain S-box-containing protein
VDRIADALEALDEGIQVISPEWRYVYLNAAAARQGRRAADELVGRAMMECYPGIEHTLLFAVLRECLIEQRARVIDNEFVYSDGRSTWFELRIRPTRSGLVIVSIDQTDRREAERRVLRELVTPVLAVHAGVLLVPLVGLLDHERAVGIIERVRACATLALVGARTVLTGVSPAAALALVDLRVDLSAMVTTRRLDEGLAVAMELVRDARRIVR